jgi:hypothetical protein
METTTLAVVEPQEAVSLLESPLSPAEAAQLQSCELAIELAGKDRLEKALIIGEKLSTIYNEALFRGADGGRRWEQWLKERLPRCCRRPKAKSLDGATIAGSVGGQNVARSGTVPGANLLIK